MPVEYLLTAVPAGVNGEAQRRPHLRCRAEDGRRQAVAMLPGFALDAGSNAAVAGVCRVRQRLKIRGGLRDSRDAA